MTFKEMDKIVKFDALTTWSFNLDQLECVVYLLLHKGECVYVGLTENEQLFRRMSAHLAAKKKGTKEFDEIKMLCIIDSKRGRYVESIFICNLNPKYNKRGREDHYKNYSAYYNKEWLKDLFSEEGILKKALIGKKKKVRPKDYVKRKRITFAQVLEIQARIKTGMSCAKIEIKSGFGLATIHKIKAGTHYLCKKLN